MVNTADEITFAFQAGNDAAPGSTTPRAGISAGSSHSSDSSGSTDSPAVASLAQPPLGTHALMPPPPPRVRPSRGQEEEEPQQQPQHQEQGAGGEQMQQQQREEQLQQQVQQQQQQRHDESEAHDPHNPSPPAPQPEMENGGNTLADKFHLMQMGVVDAAALEGKGPLMDPTTPTLNGVMEGFAPPGLVMHTMGGTDAFGHDVEEEADEEEEGEGDEHGHYRYRRGMVHCDEDDDEDDDEIYRAEGGYISSPSSDVSKATLDHEAPLHYSHYSSGAAATSSSGGRHYPSTMTAAVAAAAAAASNRARTSSNSVHKKTGTHHSSSRPVRVGSAARRHHPGEAKRSPPSAGGGAFRGASPVPQAPKKCNCRKSKCLKLYCECFAAGAFCQDDCGCLDCNNTLAFEEVRNTAIDSILSRNPHAFTQKIQFIDPSAAGAGVGGAARRPHVGAGPRDETQVVGGAQGQAGNALPTAAHVRGCNCKKSLCIKKYCECFFAGVYCGDNCQCEGCKNCPSNEGLLHNKPSNSGAASKKKVAGAGAKAGHHHPPAHLPPSTPSPTPTLVSETAAV